MGRRRLRSAMARWLALRWIATGCGPCRFAMTRTGLVVAGSEAGLVDLDPEEVTHSGRLGPGQMLVVDLVNHKVYEDEALLELFDAGATYADAG